MGGVARATTSWVTRRRELQRLTGLLGPAPALDPTQVLIVGEDRRIATDVASLPRLADPSEIPTQVEWVVFLGDVQPVAEDWLAYLLQPGESDVRTAPILISQPAPRRPLSVLARGWLLGSIDGTPSPVPIAPGSDPDTAIVARHLAELAPGSLVAVRTQMARELIGVTPSQLGGTLASFGHPVDVIGAATVTGRAPTWASLPSTPPTAPLREYADETMVDLATPDLAPIREGADLAPAVGQRLHPDSVTPGPTGDWVGYRSGSQPTARRFTIRVAPATRHVAEEWGDTHLARGLARALGEAGSIARIAVRDEWPHPHFDRTDTVVHLRGLAPFHPSERATNVLWIISHPTDVRPDELDRADIVLVASLRDAARLAEATSTPVLPFLQAANPGPGVIERSGPPKVRFVGNTSGRTRPVVAAARSAGIPIQVNGTGWDEVPGVEAGPPIPNTEIMSAYAGSIVLVDHWPDMATAGYVNNRVFDAFAAGGVPVSDEVAGIDQLLGGLVPIWHSPEDLKATTERLSDGLEFAALANLGREAVLSQHTFAHRAEALHLILEGVAPDERLLGLP